MAERFSPIIFDKINKKIKDALKELEKPENTKLFADDVADDIRKRTRLGFGVPENKASKQKLKPLRPLTIKQRLELKKAGELDQRTTPKRSNLTRTGQLLDSIQGTKKKGEIVVEIKEGRKGERVKNSEIVENQEKQGRPFFYITDIEFKKLTRDIKKSILKIIRGNLKNNA